MNGKTISPTGVRIPDDLRQRLKLIAQRNRRSMNAEIIFQLEKLLLDPPENEKADAQRA